MHCKSLKSICKMDECNCMFTLQTKPDSVKNHPYCNLNIMSQYIYTCLHVCVIFVWEVRKGVRCGVHTNTLHLKKGRETKVRLVGGDTCSLLSSIWPKCLTSNFASSPQEHKAAPFPDVLRTGPKHGYMWSIPTQLHWGKMKVCQEETGSREGVRVFILVLLTI